MNGWLWLVFLVASGIAVRAFWMVSPRFYKPETNHCWHPGPYHETNKVVVCCHCDEKFDPFDMIQKPGCGPYAPKDWYPKPTPVCPKRPVV